MRILACLLVLSACGSAPAPVATTPVAAVAKVEASNSAGLKAALDNKTVPVLVDVRTPEEYAAGHVPGALNVPIDDLKNRLAELDKYKSGKVWVICQSGGRSARASDLLAGAGFSPVNVADGTAGWKAAGYPVE